MLLASTVALVFVWHPVAHATVWSWKGEGGVLMLSNDPGDVPTDQRASAHRFTAKPAPGPAPDEAAPPPQPTPDAAQADAYERGFDAGLQAAERQVALAEELASTLLAAVPQTPPAPIVIEQSSPAVPPDVAPDVDYGGVPPYGGLAGPYVPYPFPYGFAVGFVSHRHFFPGAQGRRFAPFLRHSQFTRAGIGWMR